MQPHTEPVHVAGQAHALRHCACGVHLSSPSGFCNFFFQSNGKPCPWSIPAQMISLVELAVVGVATSTQKETSASVLGAEVRGCREHETLAWGRHSMLLLFWLARHE